MSHLVEELQTSPSYCCLSMPSRYAEMLSKTYAVRNTFYLGGGHCNPSCLYKTLTWYPYNFKMVYCFQFSMNRPFLLRNQSMQWERISKEGAEDGMGRSYQLKIIWSTKLQRNQIQRRRKYPYNKGSSGEHVPASINLKPFVPDLL